MYICRRNKENASNLIALGRLAQLVQSTSFTPRGSGVRTPHRPQNFSRNWGVFFCLIVYGIRYGSTLKPVELKKLRDQSQNLWI